MIKDGRLYLHGDQCPPPPGYKGGRFHFWCTHCQGAFTHEHFWHGGADLDNLGQFLMEDYDLSDEAVPPFLPHLRQQWHTRRRAYRPQSPVNLFASSHCSNSEAEAA